MTEMSFLGCACARRTSPQDRRAERGDGSDLQETAAIELCSSQVPLMIVQKLFRIQDRPQHILKNLAAILALQLGQNPFPLGSGRDSAPATSGRCGSTAARRSGRDPASTVASFLWIVSPRDQVQRLDDVRL